MIKANSLFCKYVNMPKRHKNVIWGIASLEAALDASMPVTPSSGIQDKFTPKLSLKSE
jgi:hypothetical protein